MNEAQQLINMSELALSKVKAIQEYHYQIAIADGVITIELEKTDSDTLSLFDIANLAISEVKKVKGYSYSLVISDRDNGENITIKIEKSKDTFVDLIHSLDTNLDNQVVEDFIQYLVNAIMDENDNSVRVENGRIYIDSRKKFFAQHGVGELRKPLNKLIGTTKKFSARYFDMKYI